MRGRKGAEKKAEKASGPFFRLPQEAKPKQARKRVLTTFLALFWPEITTKVAAPSGPSCQPMNSMRSCHSCGSLAWAARTRNDTTRAKVVRRRIVKIPGEWCPV